MAVLNQEEIVEAIKEWCDKRGLPFTDNIVLGARFEKGTVNVNNVTNSSHEFYVQIRDIEMPLKDGPYR